MNQLHTKQSLMNDLRNMGMDPADTLLMHSSMKSIGEVEGGADTVLDALSEYLSAGLLILPAHTWSTVNSANPVFDVRESSTCVGVLTERFRKRPGVIRTLHPTHSLSCLGSDAESFASGQERFDTPCAPESCYGRLEKRDAKILLVGVNFSRNTTVHCIEEVAQVPGRLSAGHQQLFVKDYDGHLISVPSRRHENSNSETFVKLEPVLYRRNLLQNTLFGDAHCLLVQAKDLFDVTLEMLNRNPRLFDDFAPIPEQWF